MTVVRPSDENTRLAAGVSFEEHERYKRCLYRANGRLTLFGHEPEKLSYSDQAAADVLAERRRQVTVEGWTPEHDDAHSNFEMSAAAASYALRAPLPHDQGDLGVPMQWPWSPKWWKPTDARRDLVKAAALIIAEIERIDRYKPLRDETPEEQDEDGRR